MRTIISPDTGRESEILLVDEVLAVGDAKSQENCLGTMQASTSSGKTVLFVSHNLPSVRHICRRAILLDGGRIAGEGRPREVIARLSDVLDGSSVWIQDWPDRVATSEARLVRSNVANGNEPTHPVSVGGSVRFSIFVAFDEPLVAPCFGILVHNAAGEAILDIGSSHDGLRLGRIQGAAVLKASVEHLGLYPGRYFLSPWITDSSSTRAVDWAKLCSTLHVPSASELYGYAQLDPAWRKYWVPSKWTITVPTGA